MERPALLYVVLPISTISIILYTRIIILAWRKSASMTFNTFFFRQTRSQAILDISYVIVYFLTELPQEWKELWHLLTDLNGTIVPQLIYCHTYLSIFGQSYGIALIALNRMLLVCCPTSRICVAMNSLSYHKIFVMHMIPPLCYALYMLFGQPLSYFGDAGPPVGITRITAPWCVRLNSDIAAAIILTCAIVCAISYLLIFRVLVKRPLYSWRRDLPLLITSFALFLALCLVALFSFSNRFWTDHYYIFAFPVALINPWCLLLTSGTIRGLVIGERLKSKLQRLPALGKLVSTTRPDIAISSNVQSHSRR